MCRVRTPLSAPITPNWASPIRDVCVMDFKRRRHYSQKSLPKTTQPRNRTEPQQWGVELAVQNIGPLTVMTAAAMAPETIMSQPRAAYLLC
mmetsp:Transcript_55350/g.147778  ORF Transcript_55350/g.147778 Transcript_55350/m.147778 type:complete len:91 (+) Transcript_55350:22-294(+)